MEAFPTVKYDITENSVEESTPLTPLSVAISINIKCLGKFFHNKIVNNNIRRFMTTHIIEKKSTAEGYTCRRFHELCEGR